GTYTQSAGSTYTVEVNNAGQSDKIAVTGNAVINGGTVVAKRVGSSPTSTTSYTILSATGSRNGAYAGVTGDFAFLTPSLSYSAHAVTLTLSRTGSAFQNGARTLNQKAVGAALDQASLTTGNSTVLDTLYGLSTSEGPQALNALSGQNYAGFGSLMMQ